MRKYSHATIICSLMAILSLALAGSQVSAAPLSAGPLGTAFTYQGQLKDGSGNPITNTCDFQFGLFDALTSGVQIGSTQTMTGVTVTNGYFTSSLDFGPGTFGGDARWLEIAVRCPAGGGPYTTLTPRQPLTPAPYSLYALNAGLLNNLPSTSFQQHYQNLLVVAKSGGDYSTITDALNHITTAGPTNRFLIYVAPGIFNETVTMKPYVDIEGAGELATKITYAGSATETGTVIGANNSELRFVTVENTGGNAFAYAIYDSSASPHLTHVTATASGALNHNCGVANLNSSPMMTNVSASGSGGTDSCGVSNASSSPTMTNVSAAASGAGTNYGVYNSFHASPNMTNVNATVTGSGGSNNYGVDNDVHSSPAMLNVTTIVSGASGYNYGVYNYDSSSPMMTHVTSSASGGASSYNYGVYNGASSSPVMTNVTATASNGLWNYGVWNDFSSATIQGNVITATGGTNNVGIANYASSGSYTVTVDNSQVTGSSNTIKKTSQVTTLVGASLLNGGPVLTLGGTLTCAGVYDENYVFYASTCP